MLTEFTPVIYVHPPHENVILLGRRNSIVFILINICCISVLLTQYRAYSVRVNDVYVTRGNTAVFKCSIDPYFVREYITVTSWTQGATPITTGTYIISFTCNS